MAGDGRRGVNGWHMIRRLLVVVPALMALLGCGDAPPPPAEVPEAPPPVADAVRAVTWSPDGRNLLVSWYRGDRHRLYVVFGPPGPGVPPDPSRGIPMMEDEALRGTWAPDRLWVAFQTSRDGNDEIYRARPDGMAPENLTADPADDQSPVYSPDSRRIAFSSNRGGGAMGIWIMEADGGDPRPLGAALPAGDQRWPAWSPDGRRLALSVHVAAADRIHVASMDGSSAAEVATGVRPAWSHDGRRLYYDRADSVFVRAADGSGEETFVVIGRAPAPSPDGLWLAFVRGTQTQASLYLLDLEGRTETRITP